jgi:hypothetical protein
MGRLPRHLHQNQPTSLHHSALARWLSARMSSGHVLTVVSESRPRVKDIPSDAILARRDKIGPCQGVEPGI